MFLLDMQMAKAKKNLNTLLEPLAGNKSEAVIQELIQDNPLFQKTSIEKNSALINKRVPPSPRRIALSALHRIQALETVTFSIRRTNRMHRVL